MMQMDLRIEISVARQAMDVFEGSRLVRTYPVSTSRFGLGSEEGSNRTPLGRFVVAEKIGDGAREGTVFKSREPVGVLGEDMENGEGDFVVTRILWLDGEEEGNRNTKGRYIYIHGTNHEERLGRRASIGCVRMGNADVAELFGRVPVGTRVWIGE